MSYPQAPDHKIQKITNLLVRYAESLDYKFSYCGEDIYPVETFSYFGGLALFALEAKEYYEKIYNKLFTVEELLSIYDKPVFSNKKGLVITDEDRKKDRAYIENLEINKKFGIELVEQEENTYFGLIVRISPDKNVDFSTLSHLFVYSLDNYVKEYKLKNNIDILNEPIPLDELYDKMINKINANKINIINKDRAKIMYSKIDNANIAKNKDNI